MHPLRKRTIWNKLEDLFLIFKENLSVIVLLPTMIGGIWQLAELASIDIAYIRFFSVTQVVPDGLTIAFIMVFLYFSFKITFCYIKKLNYNSIRKTHFLLKIFILVSISYIYFMFFIVLPDQLINIITDLRLINLPSIFMAIFMLTLLLILALVMLAFIIETIALKILNSKITKYLILSDQKKFNLSILMVLILFILILNIVIRAVDSIPDLRKNILLPKNLINLHLLEDKIKYQYKVKKVPKLIYMNRDYLFYKITIEDKQEIVIVKTEKLFDEAKDKSN